VPTGYAFCAAGQNGWSRYLHFQAAWVAVFTGLLYIVSGLFTGHFRTLVPTGSDLTWRALWKVLANHLRFKRSDEAEAAWSYNVLQRLTYLFVFLMHGATSPRRLQSPTRVAVHLFATDPLSGFQHQKAPAQFHQNACPFTT
jgi:hypothetical protein